MSGPIEHGVRTALQAYFQDLGGVEPHELHRMVLDAAERPLLEIVLQQAGGNQRKAAAWLGINRNTLHRKLVQHRLIHLP